MENEKEQVHNPWHVTETNRDPNTGELKESGHIEQSEQSANGDGSELKTKE